MKPTEENELLWEIQIAKDVASLGDLPEYGCTPSCKGLILSVRDSDLAADFVVARPLTLLNLSGLKPFNGSNSRLKAFNRYIPGPNEYETLLSGITLHWNRNSVFVQRLTEQGFIRPMMKADVR